MHGRRGKGLFQQSSDGKPPEAPKDPVIRSAGKVLHDAATQTQEDSQQDERAIEKCPKHGSRSGADYSFPTLQPTLCDKCSKSMLSYIALLQHFLHGMAQDVSQKVDPLTRCPECIRENLVASALKYSPETISDDAGARQASSQRRDAYRDKTGRHISPVTDAPGRRSDGTLERNSWDPSNESPSVRGQEASSRYDESQMSHGRQTSDQGDSSCKTGGYRETSPSTPGNAPHFHGDTNTNQVPPVPASSKHYSEDSSKHETESEMLSYNDANAKQIPQAPASEQFTDFREETDPKIGKQGRPVTVHGMPSSEQARIPAGSPYSESSGASQSYGDSSSQTARSFQSGEYPGTHYSEPGHNSASQGSMQDGSPHILRDNIFDFLSTQYRTHPGSGDTFVESPFWDNENVLNKAEDPSHSTEAFVTLARNNTEALGCLVLGASLILCNTRRTLCILVADGVSTDYMGPLSSVFHVVQKIRSLDSVGTTKLSLLDQPELGISFSKLNIWRLEQFSKCVYLNYDTLVVQNCDELFCYEELSAVPDIGWPDCFNSAVFVFRPSVNTFWQLVNFAEKHGSYDDGDQGLMNSYFHTWSKDIHKKLSFIYNLMANVSYTYTPAFRQFGRNVKIVQFISTFKPWHVKFYSESGQIAPASSVHPTYVQFIHVWLRVFRFKILSLLSQEIQNFISSENVVSAQELLRFFSSPNESELEFLLTPPSVRLRPFDRPQIGHSAEFMENIRRSSSSPNLRSTSIPEAHTPEATVEDDGERQTEQAPDAEETEAARSGAVPDDETEPEDGATTGSMPGSEVGNYQGMSAWEQGRMDYQGSASSDTIIKRLHFLMKQPDRLV